MKRALILIALCLPMVAMAQTDTLYFKGGNKISAQILRVEKKNVIVSSSDGDKAILKTNLDKYYWTKVPFEPKRGDTQIIIETSDSPDKAFTKIGQLLSEAGYPIATANKEIGVITTGKLAKGTLDLITFNAIIKADEATKIILNGLYDAEDITLINTTDYRRGYIYFSSSSNSASGRAWQEMDKLAKSYPEGKISYSRR